MNLDSQKKWYKIPSRAVSPPAKTQWEPREHFVLKTHKAFQITNTDCWSLTATSAKLSTQNDLVCIMAQQQETTSVTFWDLEKDKKENVPVVLSVLSRR